ncbi:hypothetical protein [Mesorhizobium sp. 131-2-1]|uniref:hypothetical protein n=1 Tax=Mesorhizobium sp. 131-2-1 TaxID=2744518 RepID=UPI0018EB5388|nr:hypothetical protein [Mesorhizobium sp. 131-2-1]BCG97734.1 hypothetical protein MesoLj131a_65980 [Mesorhizobium sp. 131-2-1]
MSAEQIQKHFVRFLGVDVGVSFKDPADPREVVLYRPDRLSETFVTWAFEELEKTAPNIAGKIDRLLVSYESPLGRTQRGVNISANDRPRQPLEAEPLSKAEASGTTA